MKDFKTWGDWHTWARRSYIRYDPAPFPFDTAHMTQAQMEDFLWRANCEFRRGCEQVVHRLAEIGRWPPSASEHAYFLTRRLQYALEILSVVGDFGRVPPPVAPPQAPRDTILQWLLIDAWESCGWRRWADQLLAGHEQKIGLRV